MILPAAPELRSLCSSKAASFPFPEFESVSGADSRSFLCSRSNKSAWSRVAAEAAAAAGAAVGTIPTDDRECPDHAAKNAARAAAGTDSVTTALGATARFAVVGADTAAEPSVDVAPKFARQTEWSSGVILPFPVPSAPPKKGWPVAPSLSRQTV